MGITQKFFQILVIAGLSLATGAAVTKSGNAAPNPAGAADEQAIYETVLRSWLDGSHDAQMVNQRLGAPPSASENAECAKGVRFSKAAVDAPTDKTLDPATFHQRNIVLVDGDKWAADDPERSMAQGKSVDDAVKQAFSHSLISFSQVAFSEDGKDALVSFRMTCGMLCGHGFTLWMHKSNGHWNRAGECGSYVN
ncbi:MAG TPA: hypothetical protein VG407_01130 [Caulobacteraceae bacterium]|jgi:hypothetical protein|nr:hypothetical protein [Caulobacteraceae bacterium]